MKRQLLLLLLGLGLVGATPRSASAACTPTGFFRDAINMTASLINPTGTVTGPVNATGCNIGVYFSNLNGKIQQAEIYGANYFGVVVNGDANIISVNVTDSFIHDIGETPLNGTQHGVAIYYRAFFLTGSANGTISGNTLSNYQKGGIVVNGQGVNVTVTDNIVTGQGPVDFIAQNGIQVGFGAGASVMRNTVTGNAYTGTNNASSAGILVVGGPGFRTCPDGSDCPYTVGTRIVGNQATGNDVGVFLANFDASFKPPPSATNIKVVNNTLSNLFVTNVSGCGSPNGYQAGVSDEGNNDKIVTNSISGFGYTDSIISDCTATSTFSIDTTSTTRAKVHANKSD
ncbi:MAG TPA: right-handed parallel beta-helix repeat-containing protein [Candidatus Acidoferrales bacterium]|nr:right-handed parallel beta-helix repeat-containing protein [Candidatus Acidoferrales bacterium]